MAAAQSSKMRSARAGSCSLYIAMPVPWKNGRPYLAAIGSSSCGVFTPEAMAITPRPRGPMAPTSASSSEIGAMVEGIGTPP